MILPDGRDGLLAALTLVLVGCGTATTHPSQGTPTHTASGTASSGERQATVPDDYDLQRIDDPAVTNPVLATIDDDVDPCDDFYQYACGGWLESTEMPADEGRWGRSFSEIRERNRERLRTILDAVRSAPGDDPDMQRLARYYDACMDTDAIDARGLEPLRPWLERVDAIDGPGAIMHLAGELERQAAPLFVTTWVDADAKDPTRNILYLWQSGLGLPDRDDYLDDDEDAKALRADYLAHIARMLELSGLSKEDAVADAERVLEVETELARISMPRNQMRDPEVTYNPVDREGLAHVAGLPWARFFAGLAGRSAPGYDALSISSERFFAGLAELIEARPLDDWRAYARYHLVDGFAPRLSEALDTAHFDFHGRRLEGLDAQKPRWKRCADQTGWWLGELVGRAYVERHFAGESRTRALEMVGLVQDAFADALRGNAWMDESTRIEALAKLDAIRNKIGYPTRWRSYEALELGPEEGWFEVQRTTLGYEADYYLDEVGEPVDRERWHMVPHTVNAYYNPALNEIVFPAGILQPPFFHADFPAAMNFGAIGMVVGHEITHGFDDGGRKYDAEGALRDWWTPTVAQEFEARAECIDVQYSAYEYQPGEFLDGTLKLGENIADLGGLKSALQAYRTWRAQGTEPVPTIGEWTDEQLFFVAFAQAWCTLARPEAEAKRARTRPHSPPRYRVNGVVSNMPEFGEAFGCSEATPMQNAPMCTVW